MVRPVFLYGAVFITMALSNAIVPVLPGLADLLSLQTLIFSSYFFGAMLTTLVSGIASDRYGQPVLIRISLCIIFLSGLLMSIPQNAVLLIPWRFIEGIGTGMFFSSALSWISYQKDTLRNTGFFMASMNLGLLSGLLGAGWLATVSGILYSGVWIFALLSFILSIVACIISIEEVGERFTVDRSLLLSETGNQVRRQYPLWISVIVLLGCTGYVQAIFPELSGAPVHEVSIILAAMNFATIITSIIAHRLKIEPVLLIRISAAMMIPVLFVFLLIPFTVLVMGALAGLIMVSQVAYLSFAEERQGIAMGLFSTFTYGGMTLLPALGGFIISVISFEGSSLIITILVIGTAIIIGRCSCKGFIIHEES